jgi:hypothetical protein
MPAKSLLLLYLLLLLLLRRRLGLTIVQEAFELPQRCLKVSSCLRCLELSL